MPEGLVTIAVEGEAEEAFGPTVAERRSERSVGIEERLRAIYECIGVSDVPNTIRYQLLDPLHRLGALPSSRQAMG